LGHDTAGDATALSALAAEEAAKEESDEDCPKRRGRKEYKGRRRQCDQVVEWFGFKLHLLVDVKHEVVLSYEVHRHQAGDGETLPVLLDQAKANLPADRSKTLAYDKAADGEDVHKLLSDAGITPLIQMRHSGRPNRADAAGHDGSSNIVYTEDGTIYFMIR